MNIDEIKKRYENAYLEVFGDYDIVHVDKKELDWLIDQAEQLEQFKNQFEQFQKRYEEFQVKWKEYDKQQKDPFFKGYKPKNYFNI
jgi:Zn-finger nucleic acid-binding protein